MGDLLGSLVWGSQKQTILCHWGWVPALEPLFFALEHFAVHNVEFTFEASK
jgi:hypothetical protein